MSIVEINPKGMTEHFEGEGPSVTRGANFMYEAMRVGAEECALHFMASKDDVREKEIGDVKEFIGFSRDLIYALENWHVDQMKIRIPLIQEK